MIRASGLIAAAGGGERLGAGVPKAFVVVAGRPLAAWSLAAFAEAVTIDEIVFVVPEGSEADGEQLIASLGIEATIVAGGPSRAESVEAGAGAASGPLVAIHDAARPLVDAALIDALVELVAADEGLAGAIAATPVADTLKRADAAGMIGATVDRSGLWAAQTPQVFRSEQLRAAWPADRDALAGATDEAMLVEAAGGKIALHDPGAPNPKLTTPADLALVELILSDAERGARVKR